MAVLLFPIKLYAVS